MTDPSAVRTAGEVLVQERTAGFVGRDYVFREIATFVERERSGYLVIVGDPGDGKTTILAEYTRRHATIAHFNSTSLGVTSTADFLANVCTQLAQRFDLPYASMPPGGRANGTILLQMLQRVSAALGGAKLVIVVDALDEAEPVVEGRANILFLPEALPPGIFMLLSRRRVDVRLVATPQRPVDLRKFADQAREDIEQYIRQKLADPGVRDWIDRQEDLTVDDFVRKLSARSGTNFMFVRYLMADIGAGIYRDATVTDLPVSLESYYEDHWTLMGMRAKPLPRDRLNILYALSQAHRPVSVEFIAELAQEDGLTVLSVVQEWNQFLHPTTVDGTIRYSVYHQSFREFLHRKDIVEAAGVSLRGIARLSVEGLWRETYEDDGGAG